LTVVRYGLHMSLRIDEYVAEQAITESPKKMYTLFTHQYLWNKFK